MAGHSSVPDRHVPANTNGGWPIAIFVIILAVVINAGVAYIHNSTESWRRPQDPEWRAHGGQTEAAH